MNILKFVSALSNKIQKQDILDNLNAVADDIAKTTLPMIDNFEKTFPSFKPESAQVKEMERDLQRATRENGNFLSIFRHALKESALMLDVAKDQIKDFPDNLYKQNITYQQQNVLQLISLASFVTRYVRNYVVAALSFEVKAIAKNDIAVNLKNAEVKRLEDEKKAFINCITTLFRAGSTAQIVKKIQEMPKSFVTEDTYKIFSDTKGDPFHLNFMDTRLNPLFFFGEIIAEWQAESYREAIEDYDAQKLMLAQLQLVQQRQNDPALEKRIQQQLEKIEKIRMTIEDKERKYGLNR